MYTLPAVLIAGPPHSGKSVLAYHLTMALRTRGINHYVLRAYPDGEGDWSYEADQDRVRAIRTKGYGDEKWVARTRADIANRHYPLIVDVGGRPTPFQETIFDECTHAVLLWTEQSSRDEWLHRLERHGLPLLADLHSQLVGLEEIEQTRPILCGTIVGLERERGQTPPGPTFQAVIDTIAALFATDEIALRRQHLEAAPVELAVDLERLAVTFDLPGEPRRWRSEDLPRLLAYLPAQKPIALYGRAPCWLYAAAAVYVRPAAFWQFDVRLGWIQPPTLHFGAQQEKPPWCYKLTSGSGHVQIELLLNHPYVDWTEADGQAVPRLPDGVPIILLGKIPCWLYTALARTYAGDHQIIVQQPQLPTGVVINR